jgi:putative colanic acid biosysnthesis UDP-glucose lipid carrier transferase
MNGRRGIHLKENASALELVFRLLDPLLVVVVAWIVHAFYLDTWAMEENYWFALFATALLVLIVFPFFRIYRAFRGASLWTEIQALITAWSVVAAVLIVLFFSTKTGASFSRVWMGTWAIASLATLVSFRLLLRLALRQLRRKGANLRHIAIVGAGDLGREVARRLKQATWTGLNVVAFFDDDPELHDSEWHGVKVLGKVDDVRTYLDTEGLDQVWITLPLRAEDRVKHLLQSLGDTTVEIRYMPDIFGFQLLNHSLTEVAGLPVINLTESPMVGANRVLKAIEDYVLATLIIIMIAPVLASIAIAVKLSSPGPVIYRQRRVTWNGEHFNIYKFRTMPVMAESASGAVWARADDDRATPLGRWLRRYSLDELPQFFNVLKGEMSIVGPRPERPEFIERFRQEVPGYMQKHFVKAGITGWAQVNDLRGNTDLSQRIEYDLFYIDNWSLTFDLRIIAMTVVKMFSAKNAY